MAIDISRSPDKALKILVVDDHSLTRTMVRAILKGIGFENILQAENGQEAVEHILHGNIEIVICDWNMPEGTGLEVLKTIRTDERFRDLPFIMLTAEAYRENVAAALSAGVTDYIVKPFTADVLAEKLNLVLEKRNKRKK